MRHVVTHPAGSEIELVSYYSSEALSHSAYAMTCCMPYWLLV